MAAVVELGQEFSAAKAALKHFPGAKRRFQVVSTAGGITIVDDYAHHPTEITATITAARQVHPGRLLVVFQPHRYSRTQLLADQFGAAFRGADLTVITDVYAAGEKTVPGVSGELVYRAVKNAGGEAVYIPTLDDSRKFILTQLQEGDMLITMGAGDVWTLGAQIAVSLASSEED